MDRKWPTGMVLILIRTLQILGFHANPLEPVELVVDSDSSKVPRPSDCLDQTNISPVWSTLSFVIIVFEIIGVKLSFHRIDNLLETVENTVDISTMILWLVSWPILHLIAKISIVLQPRATRSFINNLARFQSIFGPPIKFSLKTAFATVFFICLLFCEILFEIQFENNSLPSDPSFWDKMKFINNAIAWIFYYVSVMVLPLFNILAINCMKIQLEKPLSILNFFNAGFYQMANQGQIFHKPRRNLQFLKDNFQEFSTETNDRNIREEYVVKSSKHPDNLHVGINAVMKLSTATKIDFIEQKPSINSTQNLSSENCFNGLLTATLSPEDVRLLERTVLECDETVVQYMSTYGIGLLCHTIMHVGGLTYTCSSMIIDFLNKESIAYAPVYITMTTVYLFCLHLPAEQYNRVVSKLRVFN